MCFIIFFSKNMFQNVFYKFKNLKKNWKQVIQESVQIMVE